MINVAEIGKQIGEQVANEPAPGFYPGGFKPPHKGHFSAAFQAASKPFVEKLKVIIGHGVRDEEGVNITPEQSKAIWEIYLSSQPNPKISVEISPDKSPIKPLYSYFADINNKGYVVGAQDEIDKGYFVQLEDRFPDRVFPLVVNDVFNDKDDERVSGTEFRDSLAKMKQDYQTLKQQQKGTTEYTKALNEYNNIYNYIKSLMPDAVVNKGKYDDVLRVLGMNYPPPTSLDEKKDIIPGGLAKDKTPKDLAKRHKVSLEVIKKALQKGVKVELEHTTSKQAALEIAMDHIFEDPKYYDKLSKIEEGQPNPKNQPNWVWLEEYKNKDKFNPAVFETDDKLDEKVKELLLKIATYFWEQLDLGEPFDDVTLTGSSANYNYSPYSDIDLHIIVDFNKFKEPEMMKKFFDKAKNNWNANHDLKLGKQPIEIYVQDSNEKHTSSGVYSVMNDKWIKKPEYESINIPDGNIKRKSKPYKEKINDLVRLGTKNPEQSLKQIEKLQERLKNFRQAGLDKNGEYSLENLAFKDLRNTGYLDKLSKLKNELVDKKLSLQESIQDTSLFEKFMSYACQELQIQQPPTFEVRYEFGEDQPSFGAYVPANHHIFINPSNRNVVDILRTLAHELVHAKQNELGILKPDSGETGSDHENDANSIAGILMRDYGKNNPSIYNIGVMNESETKTTITCDSCGWSWKKSKGGKDMYTCHKCHHDNTPKLNENKTGNPLNLKYIDIWHNGQDLAFKNKTKEAIKIMTQAAKEAKEFAQKNDNDLAEFKYYLSTIDWLKGNYKTAEKYINDKEVINSKNDIVLKRLLQNRGKSYKDAYSSDLNESKEDWKKTSWENEKGQKITISQLLNTIKDYPVVQAPIEKVKKIVIKKDTGGIESNRLNKANTQYPIIIVVDSNNNYKYILDGNHRANKAIDNKEKTIPAKLVDVNKLPKKFQDVLNEAKETNPPITRIYLDMDGVIAGFDDQFKKYNDEGLDFKEYIEKYGSSKAWDIINKGKTKFWSGMDWNPGGKQLYDRVMKLADEKNIEVWVLSSPGLDPNGDAKKGKNEWLDKHTNIPQNRRVYKQAKDKHTEAKPGYMLIDDMGVNVSQFIEAGGTGIKNNPNDSTESIKKLYKFKYEQRNPTK